MNKSLQGEWQFGFGDSKNIEYPSLLDDTIILPSTTEQSGKGEYALDQTETLHLSRKYPFTGVCYYKKVIEIPKEWDGKYIALFLERTKFTKVWVDGKFCSRSFETIIPQRHDLSASLTVGKHEITIAVDNELGKYANFPESLFNGHQYTEHTQTNWNGIIGEICLIVSEPIRITQARVIGQPLQKQFTATLTIENNTDIEDIQVIISGQYAKLDKCHDLQSVVREVAVKKGENIVVVTDTLQSAWMLWDEFNPTIYDIVFTIKAINEDTIYHNYTVQTGFVDINIQDKTIKINGMPIFLRGNIDCGLYPLTGTPPMDLESWMEIFKLMKAYGINHYRFHSWCPPRAAFEAADRMGMYIQAELSCFANGLYTKGHMDYDEALNDYLYDQAIKLIQEFGNHPSFIMFAVGNEMIGEVAAFESLLLRLKDYRSDKLYTQGSNNFLEDPVCTNEDDYWVIMRTSKTDNIRASYSHSDVPLGHLQTMQKPSTMTDYKQALEKAAMPLIAHEVGQYQVYPDYKETQKYTGVLYPTAFDIFKGRLEEKGLGDLADKYFKASGKLASLCYREDIEAILRTANMSGFQLLGLQDFAGQGTALIGILDSFLDSKGIITSKTWREFCNDQVLLAKFSQYTYTIGEEIALEVLLYNFGREAIKNKELSVTLRAEDSVVDCHILTHVNAPRGTLTRIERVVLKTSHIKASAKGEIILECGELINHYPVWFYPNEKLEANPEIFITETISQEAIKELEKGGRVMLLGNNLSKEHSIEGFFASDFWCYPMFKKTCEDKGAKVAPGTLGLLCDKDHPVLAMFPTESYTEWQWHSIVMHSRPIILDDTDKGFRPIVQVIDNFDRNHKLGLVFEANVLNGKVLICASDILGNLDKPEVKRLYNSLLAYVKGQDFNPSGTLDISQVTKWANV